MTVSRALVPADLSGVKVVEVVHLSVQLGARHGGHADPQDAGSRGCRFCDERAHTRRIHVVPSLGAIDQHLSVDDGVLCVVGAYADDRQLGMEMGQVVLELTRPVEIVRSA